MYKYLLVIIFIAAIFTLSGCDNNNAEFNPNDLFFSDVVHVVSSPNPVEEPQSPNTPAQSNDAGSDIDDFDVPLENQLDPADFPVFDEPYDVPEEHIAELRMIKERLASLYGDNFVHHQTAIGDFDMVEFEDGAISIMTSSLGEVMGVFYEFYYELSDELDDLHERVSKFSFAMTGTELSDEDNLSIANALVKLSVGMPDPVFIRVGDHAYSITYRSDGVVSIVF